MIAVFVAGCSSGEPEPPPDLELRYQPVPPDLCERVAVDDFAAPFDDLVVRPDYEPTDNYGESPLRWSATCRVWLEEESGRLDTKTTWFDPSVMVSIDVFREPDRAGRNYELNGHRMVPDRELNHSATVDAKGWWTEGTSAEYVQPMTDGYDPDFEESVSWVGYRFYHKNLYVAAEFHAPHPSADTEEVLALGTNC